MCISDCHTVLKCENCDEIICTIHRNKAHILVNVYRFSTGCLTETLRMICVVRRQNGLSSHKSKKIYQNMCIVSVYGADYLVTILCVLKQYGAEAVMLVKSWDRPPSKFGKLDYFADNLKSWSGFPSNNQFSYPYFVP